MEPNIIKTISINDFVTICRVCLVSSENMNALSSSRIFEMLTECTSVQDEWENQLPQQICNKCVGDLKNAYNFKRQCVASFEILRNILNDEYEEKSLVKEASTDILSELKLELLDYDTNRKLNGTSIADVDLKNNSIFELNSAKLEESDNDIKDNVFDNSSDDESVKEEADENLTETEKQNENDEKDTESNAQKQKSVADILIKKYNIYGLTCNICKKDLSNRFSMLRHMEVHDQNRPLKYHCKTCNKRFYAAENLKKHEIRHLGKTKYECEQCSKRFYVLSALGVHCKSSHKAKPLKCSKCSQQFYHPLQVEQHLQSHEEKKFVCEDCGKIFPTKNRLTKHKKIHSDERPYKCTMCESAFKQKFNLNIHIKLRHLECDRREMCNVCGKLFHPGSLRAHLETHNTDTIYKCQECGKTYANRIILSKHINQKHKNGGVSKQYVCEICSKALGSSGSLRKHMMVMHSSLEKSECHICGKAYKSPNGVKVHILSAHMDERPFICQTCNKAFHSKNVLDKHMRTHTGERPFSCNICGKAFGFKQVLKTHMKVHAK